MHKHPAKTVKKEAENISAKVQTTKKEIEVLKSELQKLLNLGTQSSLGKTSTEIDQLKSFELNQPSTSQRDTEPVEKPLQKNVPQSIQKPFPEPQKKMQSTTETITCKKKTYNKAETREYMKKQKEKRAEQIKAQINVADNKIDLKKQKLRELHQKATELVAKNVQLKRERSKSRDNVAAIRLDKPNPRQRSQEIGVKPRQLASKSQERLRETRAKSQEPRKPVVSEHASRSRARNKPPEIIIVPTEPAKIDPKFLHPPEMKLATNKDDFEKTTYPSVENNQTDLNERISQPPPVQLKQLLEHAILTDACMKDSKETQTTHADKFIDTAWMQAHATLPCPYNFINTVKRKLQYTINSPRSHVDVGVNVGGHSNGATPIEGRSKTKAEIRELVNKSSRSDLQSFASHKANLDLKTVENLELIPPNPAKLKSHQDLGSKNLYCDFGDSESDTSKNIPEISSESLSAANGNSNLHLSLDKLKDLKLKKGDKSPGYSYSSDFNEERSVNTNTNTSSIKTTQTGKNVGGTVLLNSPNNADNANSKGDSRGTWVTSQLLSGTAISVIHLDTKDGGVSQKSFKSPLTESRITKTFTNSLSQQLNTEISNEDLALKEPSVFLSIPRDQRTFRVMKSKSNDAVSISATSNVEDSLHESGLEEESKSSTENKVTEKISGNFETYSGNNVQQLDANQTVCANSIENKNSSRDLTRNKLKNITIRPATSRTDNVNEIHLKFEAEVRLLNDFNKSFQQFVAVEKAFENIKSKKENNLATTKILQNVDTQTSVVTKTSTTSLSREKSSKENSTINFSRGSDIEEQLNQTNRSRDSLKLLQSNTFSTDWNLSDLNESSNTNISEVTRFSASNVEIEKFPTNNRHQALSLNIFDQLIKDEDTRIEQLKAIIKIRERALLDRTKSELVWLEIQKKQLIETGKIEEASVLKKKQRGIILKREQERNEMKKLRQSQKEASERRKNALRQERNLIKSQLSTDNMLSQMSVKKQKERRNTGPVRVVQSCSESIYSETSISVKSSVIEDVLSNTSRSLKKSDESDINVLLSQKETEKVSNAKRTLFMREAALQKRHKTAEELLRWHRKLLDKERKIKELEAKATSVIKRTPAVPDASNRHRFTGKQLNQLWRNMTGRDERKFAEEKFYALSQIDLEQLCKSARQHSNKNKKANTKHSELSMELGAISEAAKSAIKSTSDEANYSSLFESESVHDIITSQQEKSKISSSISELIDNFSRIEDEISSLSKKSEMGITSLAENLEKSSQSVIETMDPNHASETEENQTSRMVSNAEKSLQEVVQESEDSSHKEEEEKENQGIRETESSIESIAPAKDKDSWENITDEVSVKSTVAEIASAKDKDSCENFTDESAKSSVDDQKSKSEESSPVQCQISVIVENILEEKEEPSNEKQSEEESESSIVEEYIPNDVQEESLKESNRCDNLKAPVSDETITSVEETTESSEGTKNESKQITQISSSKEIDKESLALKVAIESASKIEESLTKLNNKLVGRKEENDEESVSSVKEIESIDEFGQSSEPSEISVASTDTESTPPSKKNNNQIDVRKRVSEILADASSLNKGDKSPRLQDLYITAYDIGVEFKESSEDGRQLPTNILGSEAEELWRKQLAIEQEIKQLQQQQQKEQLPYLFMREIPNKPPPPYTPPMTQPLPQSILPTDVREINEIACYSSKVLYKAHHNKNLDKVKFSENGFKLFSNVEVAKICAEFAFNICKDIAKEHYKQFETISEPSWLMLAQKPQLIRRASSDAAELERIFIRKLKDLFGFKKLKTTESAVIKWGRKRRDHVDEVLVVESQEEESHWTNFEKDELIVKNQITMDIMNILLVETADIFVKILSKKKSL